MSVASMRLLLVTPNFENNSLGRTYCLWLLASHLGWQTTIVGVRGSTLWGPLADSDFSQSCVNLSAQGAAQRAAELKRWVSWCDGAVAVKPLSSSLGVVAPVSAAIGRPLVVDIDDPDLEVRRALRPVLSRQRPHSTWGRRREVARLGRLVDNLPHMVSNPVLQQKYGGLLVPHVRTPAPAVHYRDSRTVIVRFVGSPRPHKGIDVLRAAVALVHHHGITLEVTSAAPSDAQPWEKWLGETSFEQGQALVASADVVALPSLSQGYALAQLPAKLMDAMMSGRAVVASDLPAVSWALGDTGALVPAGDVPALAAALRDLQDPGLRRTLGEAARARALEQFSVAAVAPTFADHLKATFAGRQAVVALPGGQAPPS